MRYLRRTFHPVLIFAAATLLFAAFLPTVASAAEVSIFRTEDRESFIAGDLDGLSIDPLGVLALSRRIERRGEIEEPFVLSAVGTSDGWALGTGNAGKVLHARSDGALEELWTAPEGEIQVHALHAEPDGSLVAATSPSGKVYRLRDGAAQVLLEPEAAYIWAVSRDTAGRLLVATGVPGRIYRLVDGGRGAKESDSLRWEILWESPDAHVRTLAALPDGGLLAGTAGQGLIVRVGEDGTARVLHDAPQPEIVAFAVRPDGIAYAAALASEASQVDLSLGSENGNGEAGEVEVVVDAQAMTLGTRGAGEEGPRSVIFEISTDGRVEELQRSASETVHDLLWHGEDLWVGTGEEGRLYRREGDGLVLERDLGERQITAMAAGGAGVALATTNGAALYVLPSGAVEEGTYTSQVLDAGQAARFGALRWSGEQPRGAVVELLARSGMSSAPDGTWTPWLEVGQGKSAALDDLAPGRFVQWRAVMRGKSAGSPVMEGPQLRAAELSYLQENQRPRIESLEVLAPGEILVPSSFNPQNQVFEPWSPNREGIFTTLRAAEANGSSSLKTLWKKGWRTLRWEASDPNEDTLEAALSFRSAEDSAGVWLPIVAELNKTHHSFDAGALPDGVYRFRVEVDDGPSNAGGGALTHAMASPPVTIDHTPPSRGAVTREGDVYEVTLEDTLSPIRAVEISVDAHEWRPARAADGLFDELRETVHVEAVSGGEEARLVLLRARDAAHNVVTWSLLDAQ